MVDLDPTASLSRSRPLCRTSSASVGNRRGRALPIPSWPMSFRPNGYANAPISPRRFGTRKLVTRVFWSNAAPVWSNALSFRLAHQSAVSSARVPTQTDGEMGRNAQCGNRVNRDAARSSACRTKTRAFEALADRAPAASVIPYANAANGNPAATAGGVYARIKRAENGTIRAVAGS